MTQGETSQNFTKRLHVLKTTTGERWEDIAERLGVTREHLYNYRAGKHAAPDHVVFRLEAAERAAGITSNAPVAPSAGIAQSAIDDPLAGLPPEIRTAVTTVIERLETRIEHLESLLASRFDRIESLLANKS